MRKYSPGTTLGIFWGAGINLAHHAGRDDIRDPIAGRKRRNQSSLDWKMAPNNILVLNEDVNEFQELHRLLAHAGYGVEGVHSLDEVRRRLQTGDFMAVLLDVDTFAVENRTIKDLVLSNPGVPVLCISRDRFHPGLKDAICYHIFACINKPVDPGELLYWLRCIHDDQPTS